MSIDQGRNNVEMPPEAPANTSMGWKPVDDGKERWWTGRQWSNAFRSAPSTVDILRDAIDSPEASAILATPTQPMSVEEIAAELAAPSENQAYAHGISRAVILDDDGKPIA